MNVVYALYALTVLIIGLLFMIRLVQTQNICRNQDYMKEEDLLQGWQICVDCKGRKYSACPKCKGKGTNEKLIGEYFEQVPCKRCDNGKIYCETCGGLGAYSKPK